jgi:hypothetical protein
MKKKLFFIFCLAMISFHIHAQTIRPAVLVIGNGNAAVSAAIQAAVSGVKTTILLQAGGFDIDPLTNDINSGIQADFLKRINVAKGNKDSLIIASFDKQMANEVFAKWTDTLKNLTVIRNTLWIKAERSGNNWNFKLNDGKTIKPDILISTGDAKLKEALEIKGASTADVSLLDYNSTIYRTSVSSGKLIGGGTASIFSLYNFFIPKQENLLWLKANESMLVGQAAGATAAYAGFFKTKTSLSNLKTIQGELINYKLALMPFTDVPQNDANWKAIQMVGVTGIIKAEIKNSKAIFLPAQLVSTDEIKQPLKDFYYKAQIWFDDHKAQELTIGLAIDMICYVGNKSVENTPKEIEKKWKTAYKLNSSFDAQRQINRRELAVILQDYMPPFNVNIDKTGKVVR